MKLRIKGNSIRVRLDQRDLTELLESGRIENAVRFGPDPNRAFTYAVEVGSATPDRPSVDYVAGRLVVRIDGNDAEAWQQSDLVGFDHHQAVEGGTVRLLLEKDFACLDRPPGDESDDAWAFPNPSKVC